MKNVLLVLVFLLASCKVQESVKIVEQKPVPKANTNVSVIQLVLLSNKLLLIKGSLNGTETHFIIDTGASISVFDVNQTKKHEDNKETDKLVVGLSKSQATYTVLNKTPKITLGPITVKNQVFYAADIHYLVKLIERQHGIKISGIIGNDILFRYNSVISYKNNTIVMFNVD